MDCNGPGPEIKITPIEHTADIGFLIKAPTKKQAIEAAVCSLLRLIADPQRVEKSEIVDFELGPFNDDESLIFELLNEVIYRIDAHGMLFSSFEVLELNEKLRCRLYGEEFNPAKHIIKEQVKAATYHQMIFKQDEDGWLLQVIFDV